MPVSQCQPRYMGTREGKRLELDEVDRAALAAAIEDPRRGLAWLSRHLGLDVSVLRKMARGAVKTSSERARIRRLLGVVDIKEPLSDEERELVAIYRRATQRLPDLAKGILAHARATGAEIETIFSEQVALDDRKAALEERARPLGPRSGSSGGTGRPARAV